MLGDVLFATGAQNPPSASLTRQSRFDPRYPQAAGHFFCPFSSVSFASVARRKERLMSSCEALSVSRTLTPLCDPLRQSLIPAYRSASHGPAAQLEGISEAVARVLPRGPLSGHHDLGARFLSHPQSRDR